jgi:hypothetical protein
MLGRKLKKSNFLWFLLKSVFVNNFVKPVSELFADGYALVGDVNMIVFYLAELLVVDDVRIMNPYKR